ncbi:cytosine deaminase [filamentous cyanobacterium LEGE 11480]|uniref:Cytosine deaminase n=1 Tax=Romeriopsis navalis LEGE 11480 TaxID=2777977 RepID=A0A928VS04_9CYAN|nr:cytosine deaminase [Romeriopsis navalis]MBE9033420.1 cytosine deaminase [Romeriopsis navalis LEGE 11480]
MAYDILLQKGNVLLARDCLTVMDVAIADSKIVEIAPSILTEANLVLDCTAKLISPPFVESHIHLDSVLTAGEPRWNQSGTLFEGIEIWGDRKQDLNLEDVKSRALQMLKQQAMQGVLSVRTHADVSEPSLSALQALLEVRDAVRDWMTVQVVAFPQDGIYRGERNAALMEEAIQRGADAIGGIPHYEMTREDGVRSVTQIFDWAEKYDRLIDIHCDEIDDEQSRFLEVVAACALRRQMGDHVTASHTTAFGSYNNAYALKLMGLLQQAKLNFIANPLINITLQGRTDSYPKRRGVTRVKELWQAGLNVSLGHDCVQDPWYSLGTGNLLDVAHMTAHVCQMTGMAEIDACYDMVTWYGARTLNLSDRYSIAVGNLANVVVLDVDSKYEAIRQRPVVRYVISRGRLISQVEPAQGEWLGE